MTFTHALSTNNYGTAKFIVASSPANGTHTTIGAAMTAASSGDVIFIRSGTFTEDVTHKAGVSVVTNTSGLDVAGVNVVGKWSISGPGVFNLSNIILTTNGDFCLDVSGTDATIVHLESVFINAFNNTAISYTVSNSASVIACLGSLLATTGNTEIFAMSSTGSLECYNCVTAGSSNVASTCSSGSVDFYNCTLSLPMATTSTGSISINNTRLDTHVQNSVGITSAGTGSLVSVNSYIISGTASCLSIGAGTVAVVSHTAISSTNTNTLTGAGTLQYAYISFIDTSSGHNVTTETALVQLT